MLAGFRARSLIVRAGIILGLTGALPACRAESDAAAVRQPGPPICPAAFDARAAAENSRDGDLVPEGSSAALLCVYPFPRSGSPAQYPLGKSVPLLANNVGRVVDHLNGLESPDPTIDGCLLGGHDQYQIVLGYPDDTNLTVRVDYSCGTVSAAGAVRRLDSAKKLLGFWPEGAATVSPVTGG